MTAADWVLVGLNAASLIWNLVTHLQLNALEKRNG